MNFNVAHQLIKDLLSDKTTPAGFLTDLNALSDSPEISPLQYLAQTLSLTDPEYIALIMSTAFEIEGAFELEGGAKVAPTYAFLFDVLAKLYPDVPKHEFYMLMLDETTHFAQLWENSGDFTPLSSKPLYLKKEVFAFIAAPHLGFPKYLLPNENKAAVVTLDDFSGDDVKGQIKLFCHYAQNSTAAFEKYGITPHLFREKSICALFHGASGTGKTMAAHIAAGMLNMPLLSVSMSEIFDKYIGETEKHLEDIFSRAEGKLLLFDEAETLFAKRTETESSHDKYANLTSAYLLKKLEEYSGAVILTTNLIGNFDDAFLRRMTFIVRFPMPGQAERELYWKKLLPGLDADCVKQLSVRELSAARIKEAVKLAAVIADMQGLTEITLQCVDSAVDNANMSR